MSNFKTMDFLYNVKDKINNNFFKICENGEIDKIAEYFDKRISPEKRPDINKTYLHNFTVLHIAIANGIIY